MPPLSGKDTHLYGAPRPKQSVSNKDLNSPSNISFNNALSSLITSAKTNPSSSKHATGRPRTNKKDDIFTTHNKNFKKRVAADMLGRDPTVPTNRGEKLDEDSWRRAKRKMEEKSRLYAAMKRGDVEDDEERHMVDFDRKWVERQEEGKGSDYSDQSDESGDDAEDGDQELVEYVDEFGRTRTGTRREREREEQRKNLIAMGRNEEADRFTARPSQPSNIIFGDTIQHHAFDPDEPRRTAMEELAKKRDDTPPEETHYNGRHEVRTKGQGFFHFSTDENQRKEELESLERTRRETEQARNEADQQKEEQRQARRREVEERRKAVENKRNKMKTDQFLNSLAGKFSTEQLEPK